MEPRRSTRARAREEAAPAPTPEPSKETASKVAPKSLKRKRTTGAAKESTPGTPVSESRQQPLKPTLPVKVVEGQPLPTLSEPQPVDLPSHAYQSVQQSGVLSASLQRSRAVWTSGSNFRLFHAFFTPPKKVADRTEEDKQAMQRQKEIGKNFPQLGGTIEAQLVIEPHTFPIRLYGPREMARAAPKKTPQYGQWPNHNQYSPYQSQQYSNSPAPYSTPVIPQQRPAQPKPQPKPQQKPPTPMPAATTTPAPDPVIHMLAQRAGTDPELKAVMKIVAAGQATSQQLEYFQGHINELTNMLARQKDAAAKTALQQQPPPPPPPTPPTPPPPLPPTTPSAMSAPPPHRPNMQPPPQQNSPKPYQPPTNHNTPQQVASRPIPPQQLAPHNNQYANTYGQPQPHGNQYGLASQPPRTSYRPLVFDFVEGNGDKFYFPSYSFMEWLPNNQGAKFSFLITKIKPKPKPETKPSAPSTPASKPEPLSTPGPVSVGPPNPPGPVNNNGTPNTFAPPLTPAPLQPPTAKPTPTTSTPYPAPPRIEDFDEKKDVPDIEIYQPVTVIVLSTDMDVLQSLPRAVRPADVVEKYMNDVFDGCKRAEETYLAFRLPKDGTAAVDRTESEGRTASVGGTPGATTPMGDVGMGGVAEKRKGAGRPRRSLNLV